MMRFDVAFPGLAREEMKIIRVTRDDLIPDGDYAFEEFYCNEPRCDCRRVILRIQAIPSRRTVATLNYAFEPPVPGTLHADEPQIMIDPLNPQSELSDVFAAVFEDLIETDPTFRATFIGHYELWKAVVDDPRHPDHHKVRSPEHDFPGFRPAFPARVNPPYRRDTPKVGPNDPCPCGSGKKFKRCCRP
jgi:hypothetical protein